MEGFKTKWFSSFFQSNWTLVDKSIFEEVVRVFQGGKLDSNFNNTLISLIPKVSNPISFKKFRSIALYTVMYKIITKVIANRIKHCLPMLVGPNQTSFILGRRITDNIIIAQKVIHSM